MSRTIREGVRWFLRSGLRWAILALVILAFLWFIPQLQGSYFAQQVPDLDGRRNDLDSCPSVANSSQADTEVDEAGDACVLQDNWDSDEDTLQNFKDECFTEAGPVSNGGCSIEKPYPGLRYVPLVGYQPFAGVDITPSYVDQKYAQLMKSAYHGEGNEVKFAIRKNIVWSELLVNPHTMPTHTQMRDHNWSGYKWNQPGQDDVADALGASCVQQGKCKISFQLKVAQGGINNPQATPDFMLDNNLAWIGENNEARIKFHKSEAQRWVTDFYVAALNRYGSNPKIGSVKLAEYWSGNIKPADWNRVAYENGYQAVLEDTMATVQRDANGDRVVVYQSNPVLSPDSFTCSELIAMKVGQATANPQMFEEGAERTSCVNQAHGQIPQSLAGDAPYHQSGYQITFDGTPNPWGYTAGQRVTVSLPLVFWFYGHKGVMPMDQEAIVKGSLEDNFQGAMDQFGPGGTRRAQWGGVPFSE